MHVLKLEKHVSLCAQVKPRPPLPPPPHKVGPGLPRARSPRPLMGGLLPHGHVLGVLRQLVQGRVWLQTDPVVMIPGVAPGNQHPRVSTVQMPRTPRRAPLRRGPHWDSGFSVPWTA